MQRDESSVHQSSGYVNCHCLLSPVRQTDGQTRLYSSDYTQIGSYLPHDPVRKNVQFNLGVDSDGVEKKVTEKKKQIHIEAILAGKKCNVIRKKINRPLTRRSIEERWAIAKSAECTRLHAYARHPAPFAFWHSSRAHEMAARC
ncbi:unnamed protein product, partial [Iphiclides podalirius]